MGVDDEKQVDGQKKAKNMLELLEPEQRLESQPDELDDYGVNSNASAGKRKRSVGFFNGFSPKHKSNEKV